MKIEIDIFDSLHSQLTKDIFIRNLDRFLMTGMIDQTHNNGIAIDINLFLEMFPSRFNLRQFASKRRHTAFSVFPSMRSLGLYFKSLISAQ